MRDNINYPSLINFMNIKYIIIPNLLTVNQLDEDSLPCYEDYLDEIDMQYLEDKIEDIMDFYDDDSAVGDKYILNILNNMYNSITNEVHKYIEEYNSEGTVINKYVIIEDFVECVHSNSFTYGIIPLSKSSILVNKSELAMKQIIKLQKLFQNYMSIVESEYDGKYITEECEGELYLFIISIICVMTNEPMSIYAYAP